MLAAGNIAGWLGLSLLAGGMLFFGAVVTPLVFTNLPPDYSGPFIRAMFPRYYTFVIITALLAAIGFWLRGQPVSAAVLALIAAVTVWLLFWLIPHLNGWRDAGNMSAFNTGHSVSVWINGAEILAALVLLVRTAV